MTPAGESAAVPVPSVVLPPSLATHSVRERGERVILIGTGERAARLAEQLHRGSTVLVGAVDDELQPQLPSRHPDVPWLGRLGALQEIVLSHGIEKVYVALPLRSGFDALLAARDTAERLGVTVIVAFDVFGSAQGIPVGRTGDGVALQYHQHPSRRWPARLAKRICDVVIATCAVVVLAPVLIAAAVAILLTMGRPLFFLQDRAGLNRRRFQMIKFRTMVPGDDTRRPALASLDPSGVIFKADRDPRVTWVGHWLRRTSIDELPQLFNVLRGDMSLVGPRPLPLWVLAHVSDLDFHRRSSVLPGMTGQWQVGGRVQQFSTMMRLDLSYVDHWSLGKDLRILLKTPLAVLRGTGAQ